jgi:N-acetylneuraminic acid mutarotase
MNARNRFSLFPGISIILLVGLASCQKEGAQPAVAASNLTKPELTVGLPPAYLWWATLPGAHYRDSVYGDAPSDVSSGIGFSINGTGYIVGAVPTLYRDYYFDEQENWAWDTAAKGWIRKADFPSVTPTGAVSFVIGDNAYVVGGGRTWQYNKPTDTWSPKATTPFASREYGVGMALNGKGYVGLGDHNGTLLSDWWEYDPIADLWTSKKKFPGTARTGAVGFALYNLGYVTAGYHSATSFPVSTYQYDPVTDSWVQVASFPGTGREFAVGVTGTISGLQEGLVAGGESPAGATLSDAYAFNPSSGAWGKFQTGSGGHIFAAGFVVGLSFFDCNLNCSVLNWTK